MNPKVSICMPTYNFARYLPEAIESVLTQTYRDFELLIIDDCSQDGSADLIAGYAKNDARIRFRINERNAGMVENWNLCLSHARGDYIKFLFGDDLFASATTVSRMAELLDSRDDISLVTSARNVVNERSERLEIVSFYTGEETYAGTDIIQDCLLWHKNKIGEPSAVMFRKKHAGCGFDPRYRQIVDLDMWFRILEQGRFAYIDEPLVSFRSHPLQQTRHNIANFRLIIDESFLLLADFSNKPYVKLSGMKKLYMRYQPLYSIWKLYKQHRKISRREAIELIGQRYSVRKFFFIYPLYRLYKSYMSIVHRNGARKW